MNLLKYFVFQLMLFSILIIVGFWANSRISKPFTYVDLITIAVLAFIVIFAVNLTDKLYKRLIPARLLAKVLLSITKIIKSTIFVIFSSFSFAGDLISF